MPVSFRIPNEDVVLFVIKETMKKKGNIETQEEFSYTVNKRLRKVDPKLTISGKRLRKVFLRLPRAKIKVETKKGKLPGKCPVCDSHLSKAYTKNLRGRKVLYRIFCRRCGFSGNNGKYAPKRYEFTMKK